MGLNPKLDKPATMEGTARDQKTCPASPDKLLSAWHGKGGGAKILQSYFMKGRYMNITHTPQESYWDDKELNLPATPPLVSINIHPKGQIAQECKPTEQ